MALHCPRFGAGGNSDGFYAAGWKSSLDACEYLFRMGLSAYEYECTHGVRLSDAFCSSMRKSAHDYDIALSVHAPYYINLASEDEGIRAKSIMHILKSLRVAEKMGARSVVFHPGTVGELRREEAMERAEELLEEAVFQAEREGLLETVFLCPETMGKQAQLGTLAEVLRLCEISEGLRPAVDFAHIHALTGGGLRSRADFERILHKIERRLGEEVVANLHVHFSPIEYTKAGERRHRTLRDKGFGPDFEYFADILAEHDWQPTIICESAGTQDEDACIFRQIYEGSLRDIGAV
jgi:deoxyribonuclease-4